MNRSGRIEPDEWMENLRPHAIVTWSPRSDSDERPWLTRTGRRLPDGQVGKRDEVEQMIKAQHEMFRRDTR